MLCNTLQLSLALFLAGYCIAPPSLAQVSGDGSLSTTVNSPDSRNFVIDGGDRAGNNLFHSFREFSVPTGGSASFNNAADVQNIFSRVTGGTVSNIDGLIRANGSANLFLLNPSGIIFGANARLNIGGSFVGSTANRLQFFDGTEFSITNPTSTPLLTMSAPVGLQMGQNSGSIQVQGQGHNLRSPGSTSRATTRDPQLGGLRVLPGRTLAFIGNNIRLDGGVLIAESGQVELGSMSAGSINLNTTTPRWEFRYDSAPSLSDIQLTGAALIDVSGNPGGAIHLQGQAIRIQDSSIIFIQTQGAQDAGQIRVNADVLELSGALPNRDRSLILSEKAGTGQGANIDISARQILARDGGEIFSIPYQTGRDAGNIDVNATESIQFSGFFLSNPTNSSGIYAPSPVGAGRGGDVAVTTQDLQLRDGGGILLGVFGGAGGGNLHISADKISLIGENSGTSGASVISATTFFGGDAGSIMIDTGRLFLGASGVISASTSGSGNAGDLTIRARDTVEVDGAGSVLAQHSRITASGQLLPPRFRQLFGLSSSPTGNGGNLVLTAPSIRVSNQGYIAAENVGSGDGGALRIQADSLVLAHQGQIRTAAVSGQGGTLNLTSGDVFMRDNSLISAQARGARDGGNINLQVSNILRMRSNSNISASTLGQGNGGRITVIANQLDLRHGQIGTQATGAGDAGTLQLRVGELNLNRGQIEVESQGIGNPGRLTIDADSMELSNRSVINASTQTGQGGDVQLQVRGALQLNGQSRIVADARQSGRGGNVRISAADTVLQDRSRISTNAQGTAVGGALTVEGDRLSLFDGSQITASTVGSGRAGSLNIVANDAINLSGRRTRLAATSSTDAPAGSIRLRSPQVTVSDRAAISVSGQGSGGAGDLTVNASQINLDQRGSLEAEVAGGDRGNITLDASILLMRNGSTITTNATGTASGGNININTDFLIGLENSDIVARAEQGQGGNIGLAAQSVLGILPRTELTSGSDINASSQLGFDGAVSITNPDIKPDSGLVELPEEVVDSSQQIAASCSSTQDSQFIITGRGGIPTSPDALQEGDRFWSDLRDLSAFSNDASAANQSVSSSLQPAVSEVNQWSVNAKGQVELVAVASLDSSNFMQPTCNASSPEHQSSVR